MRRKQITKKRVLSIPRAYDDGSITLPDQSLTIRQLYDRAMRGMPLSIAQREPIYNGDEIVPDLSTLDLTEIDDYRDYIRNRTTEAQSKISQMKRDAAAASKVINEQNEKRRQLEIRQEIGRLTNKNNNDE